MNKFQKEILNHILKDYPEWESFLINPKDSNNDLCIKIPCPPKSSMEKPLIIEIKDDEIIINIDYFHSHFNYWNTDQDTFSSAKLFIDNIFQETIVFSSWWQNTEWKGSTYFYSKDIKFNVPNIKDFSKQIIRSWNGNYNKDIHS